MGGEAAVSERIALGGVDFDEFYRREHVPLYRYLLLVTGSRVEAEDVAHEAFVRVLERWPRVAAMDAPRPYLYRTAINLRRNAVRRAARRARRTLLERLAEDDFTPAVEDRAEVVRVLRGLPPAQREALVLVDLAGMTSEEAADVLGIEAGAVRARVHRARENARKELGDD
jgi:RNA polymerase sigma-70 factor (ECF subfamily)